MRDEKVRKVHAFPGGRYTPRDGNAPTDPLGRNGPDHVINDIQSDSQYHNLA